MENNWSMTGGEASSHTTRRTQSIKIDIGNKLIQSISIYDCYRLISIFNNN